MKHFLLLLITLFPLGSSAQKTSKFGRTLTDTLPEKFQLNSYHLREHIYNGIPPELKSGLNERAAFRFADQSAVQLTQSFVTGKIYTDWPELEDYINQVLQKVIPPELAADTVIYAYPVKDGNFNASMTPFGIIFVNIGILDELPTEASLAAILTHELAHYYLRHSLKGYIKEKANDFDRVFFKNSRNKYSVENELQADSLGMLWMQRSPYGLAGFNDGFKAIQRLEKKALLQMEKKWELTETTHPISARRLAQVDSLARKNTTGASVDFLVSREKFTAFKEAAKSEILKRLLYQLQFDDCIEKAFKFHILDPNNPEYVYYILEGIRRKCYFNSDYWKRKFIVDLYFDEIIKPNSRRKEKITTHIFAKPPAAILGLSDEEVKQIQAGFYWEGQVKFETYEEAFDFFSQVGDLFNEPECILSNALSINNNVEVRNALLKKYLSNKKIQYRAYAAALLDGTAQSGLPNRKLTVISDLYVTVRQGSEEIYIRNEKIATQDDISPIIVPLLSDYPERQYVNLSDLQRNNIQEYDLLRELKTLTLKTFINKGEKPLIHTLDPRYWELMFRYGVNEIEFIDLSYYDARKSSTTLESYKEIIAMDINTLMAEEKRNRYLNTRISTIRAVPDGVLKSLYYGPEVKIPFHQTGREGVAAYFKEDLKRNDKSIKELDSAFGKAE